MIPTIFFLIPFTFLTTDNGDPVGVFVTDDMETWCDTQGKHQACLIQVMHYYLIIVTNPYGYDDKCNTLIEHEMFHANGIMHERDIPNNCETQIPDYMKKYLEEKNG